MKFEDWKSGVRQILKLANRPEAYNRHDSDLYRLFERALSPGDAARELANDPLSESADEIRRVENELAQIDLSPNIEVLRRIRVVFRVTGITAFVLAGLSLFFGLFAMSQPSDPSFAGLGSTMALPQGTMILAILAQTLLWTALGAVLVLLGEVAANLGANSRRLK